MVCAGGVGSMAGENGFIGAKDSDTGRGHAEGEAGIGLSVAVGRGDAGVEETGSWDHAD